MRAFARLGAGAAATGLGVLLVGGCTALIGLSDVLPELEGGADTGGHPGHDGRGGLGP